MNITKELLDHLNVKSLTIRQGALDVLCFLVRIENGIWTLSLSTSVDFAALQKVELQITFQDEKGTSFHALLLAHGEDWCTITIDEDTESRLLKNFIDALVAMERRYEQFGRRKEMRLTIGRENARQFGLAGMEQALFLPAARIQQPCVVLDASVHGICIITPFSAGAIRSADSFCIKLGFERPEQNIVLNAHKVYTRLNKVGTKAYASISCQLLEPVHFAWKERVIALLEHEAKTHA